MHLCVFWWDPLSVISTAYYQNILNLMVKWCHCQNHIVSHYHIQLMCDSMKIIKRFKVFWKVAIIFVLTLFPQRPFILTEIMQYEFSFRGKDLSISVFLTQYKANRSPGLLLYLIPTRQSPFYSHIIMHNISYIMSYNLAGYLTKK